MKKGVKITLAAAGSLLALCLASIAITLALILTPARLTNIVKRQIPAFINCRTELDRVELTFFKTFPQAGIDIKGLAFINPMPGAPSDTLLHVQEATATVNIRKLLKEKDIDVEKLILRNGKARIFIDTAGNGNFDIFKTNSAKPATEFNHTLNLRKIEAKHIDLIYKDLKSKIKADTYIGNLTVKGRYRKNHIRGNADLKTAHFAFNTLDSNQTAIGGDEIRLHLKGTVTGRDSLNGQIKLDLRQLRVKQDTLCRLPGNRMKLHGELAANRANQIVNLKNTLLSLDEYKISLDGYGRRNPETGNMALDLRYKSGDIQIAPLLALVNPMTSHALDGIDLDGHAALSGEVKGNYNEKEFPVVTANIDLEDGTLAMKGFPLDLHKINAVLELKLDVDRHTDLTIEKLDCCSGRSRAAVNGSLHNLLGNTLCSLHVNGDLNLADFKDFMPGSMNRCLGRARTDMQVKFYLDEIQKSNLGHASASGQLQLTDFDCLYNDTLALQSPKMLVSLHFPAGRSPYPGNGWMEATVEAEEWRGMKAGLGHFYGKGTKIHAFTNDLTDSTAPLKMGVEYHLADLRGTLMDSISVHLQNPDGNFVMDDPGNLALDYGGKSFEARIGQGLTACGDALRLRATAHYDANGKNTLLKWNPTAEIDLTNGRVETGRLPYPVELPTVKARLTNDDFRLQKAAARLGNSDFRIAGTLDHVGPFLHKTGMLAGDLEFVSDYTDLNQLLALTDGFRAPDSLKAPEKAVADNGKTADKAEKTANTDKADKAGSPFIVPRDMKVRLHTLVRRARIEETDIRDIEGHLTVNDGILVLEEMGFTSEAAEMRLTAMYKTPRRNHLFLGFDLHLLDISIDKLIDMIPQVDTIVPMLKNFAGNAEFHFAAETYLKSDYDLKYSTLRGAAAVRGRNLTVLDNETYRTLTKRLLFSKKTENVIDSVSAEMTVYKNEVDVYPFLVSMDKYQAILSGRHNLDRTFDYNVSVVRPVRLGIDIAGRPERFRIRLRRVKYPTLFRPERRKVVEENVLRLKNEIYSSLKDNMKGH